MEEKLLPRQPKALRYVETLFLDLFTHIHHSFLTLAEVIVKKLGIKRFPGSHQFYELLLKKLFMISDEKEELSRTGNHTMHNCQQEVVKFKRNFQWYFSIILWSVEAFSLTPQFFFSQPLLFIRKLFHLFPIGFHDVQIYFLNWKADTIWHWKSFLRFLCKAFYISKLSCMNRTCVIYPDLSRTFKRNEPLVVSSQFSRIST